MLTLLLLKNLTVLGYFYTKFVSIGVSLFNIFVNMLVFVFFYVLYDFRVKCIYCVVF